MDTNIWLGYMAAIYTFLMGVSRSTWGSDPRIRGHALWSVTFGLRSLSRLLNWICWNNDTEMKHCLSVGIYSVTQSRTRGDLSSSSKECSWIHFDVLFVALATEFHRIGVLWDIVVDTETRSAHQGNWENTTRHRCLIALTGTSYFQVIALFSCCSEAFGKQWKLQQSM